MSGLAISTTKRIETVPREELVSYTMLTCRGCGVEEEFKGTVDYNTLSHGWAALSLKTMDVNRVTDWLMCPNCQSKVRKAAGLIHK